MLAEPLPLMARYTRLGISFRDHNKGTKKAHYSDLFDDTAYTQVHHFIIFNLICTCYNSFIICRSYGIHTRKTIFRNYQFVVSEVHEFGELEYL